MKFVFLGIERIGHPILGWIIPGLILLISIGVTLLLYKKFSSRMHN